MIVLHIQVPCSQPVLVFERATEMCAFIGKHRLHPWEYRRMDGERPKPDWQRTPDSF